MKFAESGLGLCLSVRSRYLSYGVLLLVSNHLILSLADF